MPDMDAPPVAAHDVAHVDRGNEAHFVYCDGHDPAPCELAREYRAAQIHLPEDPAAEHVALGVGVLRHGEGPEDKAPGRLLCRR